MNVLRSALLTLSLFALSACSGGTGSGNNQPNKIIFSAAQVETSKLQEAINADPVYKIENSEMTLLQNEGILTEADKAQLQALQ